MNVRNIYMQNIPINLELEIHEGFVSSFIFNKHQKRFGKKNFLIKNVRFIILP